jgi:hypothetical protein
LVLVTKVWVKGLEVSYLPIVLHIGNCKLWHPICATPSNYPLENKHEVARTNQNKVVASSKSKSLIFGKNIDFINSTQDLSKSTATRQNIYIHIVYKLIIFGRRGKVRVRRFTRFYQPPCTRIVFLEF